MCVCVCVCVRVQQILIFHEQQKLEPMSLKCQPSAASQVYPRYRRERANEEKRVKGATQRDRNIERKRKAMKDSRNTKAEEIKRQTQKEEKRYRGGEEERENIEMGGRERTLWRVFWR